MNALTTHIDHRVTTLRAEADARRLATQGTTPAPGSRHERPAIRSILALGIANVVLAACVLTSAAPVTILPAGPTTLAVVDAGGSILRTHR